MHTVARIVWDVVIYRLRRREMANLLAAVTVLLAVGASWTSAAVRLSFAVLLNVLVYLTNDYYDVDADLQEGSKAPAKAGYLRQHMPQARGAQYLLLVILLIISGLWGHGLLMTLALAAGLCWAYSARLKRMPGVDLLVIFACGVTSAMTAFPLDRTLGWVLAGQLGLFAAAFQTVQMLRDRGPDARFGTSTTAVHLGDTATVWLHRALLLVSAIYATLLVNRWINLAILLAPLLPVRVNKADRH